MKTVSWKYLVLVALVLMSSACGKSDNNAFWLPQEETSTLTFTAEGELYSTPVTTTFKGTVSGNPSLYSVVTSSLIGISASKSNGHMFDEAVGLVTKGTGTGDYTVPTQASLLYIKALEFPTALLYTGSTGTITITDAGIGNGTRVKGTYDITYEVASGATYTTRMTGTFNVIRDDSQSVPGFPF